MGIAISGLIDDATCCNNLHFLDLLPFGISEEPQHDLASRRYHPSTISQGCTIVVRFDTLLGGLEVPAHGLGAILVQSSLVNRSTRS